MYVVILHICRFVPDTGLLYGCETPRKLNPGHFKEYPVPLNAELSLQVLETDFLKVTFF